MAHPLLLAANPDPAQKNFEFFEPGSTFWMPPAGAEGAAGTDTTFYFIFFVSLFFFLLVVGLMGYIVVRYRRREEGEEPRVKIKHNTALELTWTIIPLILVLVMFYMGFRRYMDLSYAPANAININVIGRQWSWTFEYPNGHQDSELHLEVGQPFQLTLMSNDVTHSLYIPVFREKKDVVPGRYTKMWFVPTEAGEFRVFCAEYCGTKHSDMVARLVVHERGRWQPWLAEASNPFKTNPMHKVGELLYVRKGCNGCHSVDGSANIGPSFQGLWGREEKMRDGSVVKADENYIRESILNPNAKVVAGYDAVMNTYQGQITDREITAVIEYIKSLSPDYVPFEERLGDPNDPNAVVDDPNAANEPGDPNTTQMAGK